MRVCVINVVINCNGIVNTAHYYYCYCTLLRLYNWLWRTTKSCDGPETSNVIQLEMGWKKKMNTSFGIYYCSRRFGVCIITTGSRFESSIFYNRDDDDNGPCVGIVGNVLYYSNNNDNNNDYRHSEIILMNATKCVVLICVKKYM